MEPTKQREARRGNGSAMGELDALVQEVFENLTGREMPGPRSGDEAAQRPPPGPLDDAPGEVIYTERWKGRAGKRRSSRPVMTEPPEPAAAELPPETDIAESELEILPPEDEKDEVERQVWLLSSEEQDFVDRTVAWLRDRPNPDLLLEHIWRLLVAKLDAAEVDATEKESDVRAEMVDEEDEAPQRDETETD